MGAEICGNTALELAAALQKIAGACPHPQPPTRESHPATASMFIINPLAVGHRTHFSTHPGTAEPGRGAGSRSRRRWAIGAAVRPPRRPSAAALVPAALAPAVGMR